MTPEMTFVRTEKPETGSFEISILDVQPEFVITDELLNEMVDHLEDPRSSHPRHCPVCAFVSIEYVPGADPRSVSELMIMKLTNPNGDSWIWRQAPPGPEDFRDNVNRFRWPD